MSIGSVRQAKLELYLAGLIRIDPGAGEQADYITIEDVWARNQAQFGDQAPANEATAPVKMPEIFEPIEPDSARLVTNPRALDDTPPRATRHTPARLVTHPRASGYTQERTNEERTNEEEGEIANRKPPHTPPGTIEWKYSTGGSV